MARGGVIEGDFTKLVAWEKAFRKVPDSLSEMSPVMAESAIDLVKQGFEDERDPYGEPWAPKVFPDGKGILKRSGRLKNSWHRRASSSHGFTIEPGVKYALFHQGGTGEHGPKRRRIKPKRAKRLSFKAGNKRYGFASVAGVKPRRMVPTASRGLPAEWSEEFKAIAVDVIGKKIAKKTKVASAPMRKGAGRSVVTSKLAGLKRSFSATALMRKVVRSISGE